MVEERITDGKRIAQFLASELTGLERGPLGRVEVVDSDPDAEPSPSGTEAYRVGFEESVAGTVVLFPAAVEVRLTGLEWEPAESAKDVTINGSTLTVESVASVKQVTDSLRVTLADDA